MNIGGWQRFSLIDYPKKVCGILFAQGCNFRCPYCHNPELVDHSLFQECLQEEEIFSFLHKRKGKLDAVSITGGEPTIQPDLVEFIERIKDIGYLTKIDTNGSRPEVLELLINRRLLDYIAMDVKAPLEKYRNIAKTKVNPDNIKKSIETIMDSGVDYEFRTTVVKSLLKKGDLEKIASIIKGARLYVLQKFAPLKCLDKKYLIKTTYSDEDFKAMAIKLKDLVQRVIVR